MIALGIVFIIVAAILLTVGWLAAARSLPGNSFIGLRVEEVRKDKETWDIAHAVAGPLWILAGVSMLFGGVAALTASGWMWIIPVAALIVGVISVSVGANLGAKAAFLHDAANASSASRCGDDGCNCGGGTAPEVNLDAVRQAATKADGK